MQHSILQGPCTHTMPIVHSAFAPFHNLWGHTTYFLRGPFDLDIQALPASSTSGSPCVSSEFHMAGFLCDGDGRVRSEDGKTAHFEVPQGQKLLVVEGGTEREQWELYNQFAEAPAPPHVPQQPHWRLPEYVTWVEQKAVAVETGKPPNACLDEALVRSFVKRIKALGLPPGKLTIDDGWQQRQDGMHTDGYWRVDTQRFPDMPGLCRWLEDEGFVPSLWFGLPRVGRGARLVRERPELFGLEKSAVAEEVPAKHVATWHEPGPELTAFYREVFEPYVQMGFRKVKLDFYYGSRQRMTALIRCAHDALRDLDPAVEIESHHPDIFFSRWVDVVRANDVNIQNGWDWQGLTLAHLRVCQLCAAGRIINLDHAGGNEPRVSEDDYIRHIRLFDVYPDLDSYPVVSLLPDRFGPNALRALRMLLEKTE